MIAVERARSRKLTKRVRWQKKTKYNKRREDKKKDSRWQRKIK